MKKISLAYAPIMLICVSVTGIIAYTRSHPALDADILRKSTESITVVALYIETALNDVKADAPFLTSTAPMCGIPHIFGSLCIDPSTESSYERWVKRFQEMLLPPLKNNHPEPSKEETR